LRTLLAIVITPSTIIAGLEPRRRDERLHLLKLLIEQWRDPR
jgi:hypothetical protein